MQSFKALRIPMHVRHGLPPLPVVTVRLSMPGSDRSVEVVAFIDTGCISGAMVSTDIARKLGVDLARCKQMRMQSATGTASDPVFPLDVVIGQEAFAKRRLDCFARKNMRKQFGFDAVLGLHAFVGGAFIYHEAAKTCAILMPATAAISDGDVDAVLGALTSKLGC